MKGPRSSRRGLRHRRWQTLLATAAMAAAVALPVVLMSVGGGVADHELKALVTSGYQLVVSGAGTHGISGAHNKSAAVAGLSGVRAASPVLTVPVDAINATNNASGVLAEGVVPETFPLTLGPTESPLFPNPLPLPDPNDTTLFANGTYQGPATWDVLVSSTYAANFRVPVGATLLLSPTLNSSLGIRFNVTGVFGVPRLFGQPTGVYAVLLPLSELQVLTHLAAGPGTGIVDAADTIEVVVTSSVATSPSALAGVQTQIRALFPYYTVTSLSQEVQQLEEASALLTGFYLALSSVGLAVGVMFLALVQIRRVETERRSIGIRRALGLSGRSIALDVVREGAFLAAVGGVLGVVAGWGVVRGLATWGTSAVQLAAELAVFDRATLAGIVLGVVGLALLAGLAAGRRALRIDVLEALR